MATPILPQDGSRSPLGTGRGLILGKLMPPHLGHQYLIGFGQQYVEHLTVLVCTRAVEPIAGELRWRWMQEMFPHSNTHLVHVTDDLPQEPHEHPDFWNIWEKVARQHTPEGVDFVFACENYGFKLAEVLDAKYIPVDRPRELVPISATAIRENPLEHWHYLPPCVRPYYVKRVCIFGPESTGKSTLAINLAQHFQTVHVGEHARPLLDHKAGVCDKDDIPLIVRGQIASEEALARHAHRLLVCDSDPLLTCVWSQTLFGEVPDWLEEIAVRRAYDLYFLTEIDVPWVDDGQRYLPEGRATFFQQCQQLLEKHDRPYVVLSGRWDERFDRAVAEVQRLLQSA